MARNMNFMCHWDTGAYYMRPTSTTMLKRCFLYATVTEVSLTWDQHRLLSSKYAFYVPLWHRCQLHQTGITHLARNMLFMCHCDTRVISGDQHPKLFSRHAFYVPLWHRCLLHETSINHFARNMHFCASVGHQPVTWCQLRSLGSKHAFYVTLWYRSVLHETSIDHFARNMVLMCQYGARARYLRPASTSLLKTSFLCATETQEPVTWYQLL